MGMQARRCQHADAPVETCLYLVFKKSQICSMFVLLLIDMLYQNRMTVPLVAG